MAIGSLPNLGNCLNRCVFRNVSFQNVTTPPFRVYQQLRGFKHFVKSASSKSRGYITPLKSVEANPRPVPFSRLWKPFLFTVAFTGTTFSVAAILEHERIKKRMYWFFHPTQEIHKAGVLREKMSLYWNSLPEAQKVFMCIALLNTLVFVAWRIPQFQPILHNYFTASPISKGLCSSMVFSMFSHYSVLHLVCNMFVLHSFTYAIVPVLGPEHFSALYLSGGVFANFMSYFYKIATKVSIPSMGASGAITAIFGFIAMQYPNADFRIVFIPQFYFTAMSALKGLLLIESLGIVLKWGFFDHAAHLSGTLFGMFWQSWGQEYLWPLRVHVLKMWKSLNDDTRFSKY